MTIHLRDTPITEAEERVLSTVLAQLRRHGATRWGTPRGTIKIGQMLDTIHAHAYRQEGYANRHHSESARFDCEALDAAATFLLAVIIEYDRVRKYVEPRVKELRGHQ